MSAERIPMLEVADYQSAVAKAVRVLGEGGLAVLPTETVYGAFGLLTQAPAMSRLRSLRSSADDKPFTIHLADAAAAGQYLDQISEIGRRLMAKLWPGPVGLMFDVSPERRAGVAASLKVAEADLYHQGKITLRCPDQLVTQDVLSQTPGPVVGTQAAGNGASHRPDQFAEELSPKVDVILDTGPSKYSKPSTLLHVRGDSYVIVREGVYDRRIIERLMRTTVLFICSGNTCRSPMAEALGRQILTESLKLSPADLEAKGYQVMSAGSFAMPGARATPQATEALKEMGLDLSAHRSRPLSVELIHQADLILTMGRSHAAAVTALVPSAAAKTMPLDPDAEIEDPIGSDVSVYRALAGSLKEKIARRLHEKSLI